MSTKTNGLELKRFYESEDPKWWPKDSYVDGISLEINGVEAGEDFDISDLQDSDQVKIIDGCYINGNNDPISFESVFRRWRKTQSTAFFSIECDLSIVDLVKAAVIAAGGKVK